MPNNDNEISDFNWQLVCLMWKTWNPVERRKTKKIRYACGNSSEPSPRPKQLVPSVDSHRTWTRPLALAVGRGGTRAGGAGARAWTGNWGSLGGPGGGWRGRLARLGAALGGILGFGRGGLGAAGRRTTAAAGAGPVVGLGGGCGSVGGNGRESDRGNGTGSERCYQTGSDFWTWGGEKTETLVWDTNTKFAGLLKRVQFS